MAETSKDIFSYRQWECGISHYLTFILTYNLKFVHTLWYWISFFLLINILLNLENKSFLFFVVFYDNWALSKEYSTKYGFGVVRLFKRCVCINIHKDSASFVYIIFDKIFQLRKTYSLFPKIKFISFSNEWFFIFMRAYIKNLTRIN